jgi:hypothetical protein
MPKLKSNMPKIDGEKREKELMEKFGGKFTKPFSADTKLNMPMPMPDVSDKNYKSNMPKIDGEKREKELMEELREKSKRSERSERYKEGIDFITGESASRRLASGGAVKKMESGGEVRASRKSARKGIDGCAVRGKTRAVRNV